MVAGMHGGRHAWWKDECRACGPGFTIVAHRTVLRLLSTALGSVCTD